MKFRLYLIFFLLLCLSLADTAPLTIEAINVASPAIITPETTLVLAVETPTPEIATPPEAIIPTPDIVTGEISPSADEDIIPEDAHFTLNKSSTRLTLEATTLDPSKEKTAPIRERPSRHASFWKDFKWEDWEDNKKADSVKITPYMSGFGEIKAYSLRIGGNRANAVKDSVYTTLLQQIKEVDFQIESRFNLLLQARINEEAEVNYNIVQEPNMPQKTDVSLRIRKTQINFGDLTKTYTLGAFTNISKRVDGISVVGSEGPFAYNFGFGQAKSQTDTYSRVGSGGLAYPLRYKPILENSVKVYVNDKLVAENTDYQVNYFEGTISFKTPKTNQDTLTFTYEYTNPLEDFIPIASHVNFLGISGEYNRTAIPEIVPLLQDVRESHLLKKGSRTVSLAYSPIILGSETISSNGHRLVQNRDYYIQYGTGKLTITDPFVSMIDVDYQTPKTNSRTEEFLGQGRQTVYYLRNIPILEGSDTVVIAGLSLNRNVDYRIDTQTGRLMFVYPIPATTLIHVEYLQSILGEDLKRTNPLNTSYKLQFGYFREFAKAQKDLNTKLLSETFTPSTRNIDNSITIKVSGWPVLPETLALVYNSTTIPSGSYTLDAYQGIITLSSAVVTGSVASDNISLSYYYYKEYGPAQWFFTGSDSTFENNMIVNGLPSHRIQSTFEQPVKFDRYNKLIIIEYKKFSSPIYLPLIYGKDYTLQYTNSGVGNGQIQVVLYNQYLGSDGVVYGVPSNLSGYDLFKITYQYNKSNIPDPGDVVHDQMEAVYQQSFGSNLDLSLDVARTNQESARSFLVTTNTIATDGNYGTTYTLGYANIVENSEIVFINNQPNAIKNENYYINYSSGKITFINMNPSTQDVVVVQYSYYTSASGENVQKYSKQGNAVKLKTHLKGEYGDTQIELYSIDPEYKPFGVSAYAGGSNIINWISAFSPYKNMQVNTTYFSNQRKLGTLNLQGKMLNLQDENLIGDVKYAPANDVQVGYHWERLLSAADPDNTTSKNLRAVDTVAYRNNLSLGGGPQDFYTTYTLSDYQYANDFLDKTNYSENRSRAWTLDNQLALLEKRVTLKSSYAESSGFSTDPNTANHKLNESSFQRSTYQLNLKPLPFLDTNHLYSKEYTQTITSFDANNIAPSQNISQIMLQNYQHGWSLYPALNLLLLDNPNYQGSTGRTEKASLLLNQLPDNSLNRTNQVGFRLLGLSNILLRNNYAEGTDSNGSIYRETSGQDYSIGGITFLSDIAPVTIQPISRRFSRSLNSNFVPRNSTLYSVGESYSTDSHYGLSWTPFSFLKYDWDFTNAENYSTSTENRSTDIAYTTQTYPRAHTKHSLSWGVDGWIKSTYAGDYDLQENEKETTYFATTNFALLTSNFLTNTTHLDSFVLNNTILQKIQPTNVNISKIYDDYIDTAKGLKYRDAQTLASDTSFTAWGAQIVPRIAYSQTLQYLRTSIDNVSLDQIQSNFNSKIHSRTYSLNVDGSQPLNNYFSLLANYGYQRILETTADPTTENNKALSVQALGVGIKSTPIPDLSLSYTYTYKMNTNEMTNMGFQNYSDAFVAQYTPAIVSTPKYTSKIIVTFTREHSWGVGLNDFAKLENNQVNNTTLATEIQTLDNISSAGIIQANVEIPMADRSNGNIEKFIFTAEGNIVEKKDLTGLSNYNYSITSLIFSGKLIF